MECTCLGSIAQALNVNVYGNGTQTVVLPLGFGKDQTIWHFLITYLACFFKVIVYDLAFSPNVQPNLHSTNTSDLLCLMDEMNVSEAIFVGHSMPAMIGCIVATQRPELFQHLILLSGSPRYLNEEGYFGGFNESDLDTIFRAMETNYFGWIQAFAPVAMGPGSLNATDEFERMLWRMNPETALSVAKTVLLSNLRSVLPQVGTDSGI